MTRLSGKTRSSRFYIYARDLHPNRRAIVGGQKQHTRSFLLQNRFGVDRNLDYVADDDATSV